MGHRAALRGSVVGRVIALTLALTALLPLTLAQSAPSPDLRSLVVGIASDQGVIAAGVPLSSGAWGTDYITISHALSVGVKLFVVRDGFPPTRTVPVAACSQRAHNIDVLILRASSHTNTRTVDWGNPYTLTSGDELLILPRPEIHPEPIVVKFVHFDLRQWLHDDDWPPEFLHVMVGDGSSKPGFSGSPWVREGEVYGLHKGSVQPSKNGKRFAVAETATRVFGCLDQLHYRDFIPTQ